MSSSVTMQFSGVSKIYDQLENNEIFTDEHLESRASQRLTEQLNMLDNDCAKANLETIVRDQTHLSRPEQASLLALMQKYEDLFEGKLGTWNCEPADIELKPDSKPFRGKPHRVPQACIDQTKKECDRLAQT